LPDSERRPVASRCRAGRWLADRNAIVALLDIFSGPDRSDGMRRRVPPLAKALAGLLSYGKLRTESGADYSERLAALRSPL